MTGEDVAAAALALVGIPFRLNGRDPATGLDCLGVVGVALKRVAALPTRTSLRRLGLGDADDLAETLGLVRSELPTIAGDIVLVRCSPVQPHVLVACGAERFVHAHAGLRRVVANPLNTEWTVTRHWRLPCS